MGTGEEATRLVLTGAQVRDATCRRRRRTVGREVYVERIGEMEGEPDHSPRYEVRVRGTFDAETGELLRVDANVHAGLGAGPHWGGSSKRLRAFGWALIHAADHMDAARGVTPPEQGRLEFPKPKRRRKR